MVTATEIDQWLITRRYCNHQPPPITSHAEARFVLTTHSGHGPECRQFLAARAALGLP